MRFVDFVIFLAAIITAGSTFAMAVEMIIGWEDAVPAVEQTLSDTGLSEFLPKGTTVSEPASQ